MKKIITSIILVGAFFVGAYTSESAETDKYVYIVAQLEDKTVMYRINKKTDVKQVAEVYSNGSFLSWQRVDGWLDF